MPREHFRINEIRDSSPEALAEFVRDVNKVFEEITRAFSEIEGTDGNKPKFSNEISLENNDIVRVKKLKFEKSALSPRGRKILSSLQATSSHSVASFAATDTALNDIGAAINEIAQALKVRGIIA